MVVDDQTAVSEAVVDILEMTDLSTLTASSGAEAIKIFEEHGDNIDLILLDIQMPHMNGLTVLKSVKALRPDTRVILSSGYSPDETVQDILSSTVSFLNKPYHYNEFITAIRQMLTP